MLYPEDLLDEAAHPRNYGLLDSPTIRCSEANASCGDSIELTAVINDDGVITAIGWVGTGCIMSRASMSVISDWIIGKSVRQIAEIHLENVLNSIGLDSITPGRIKCLELSVKVVRHIARMYSRNPSEV